MTWWQYLLLVNLYLVLFYGFYAVLLRAETFFNLNRAYLVTSSLLSFFIPLIHYEWISRLFITQRMQETIAVYAKPIIVYGYHPDEQHITIGAVIFFVYTAGAILLALRLITQLISLKKIIDQPESTSAFSFFKSIRLGNNSESQDIIAAHERVHARQWHSADVMLIEIIAIINWFNPIVYFYRRGIKHIHEFIADRQALKNGTTKSEYALLLLSQTLKTPAHDLVTPFYNHTLLKRRIMMLKKSRSRYTALVKYGLSAPLFMLMLILSSAAVIKSHTVRLFNNTAEEVLKSPATHVISGDIIKNDHPSVTEVVTGPEPKPHQVSYLHVNNTEDLKNNDPVFVSVEREPRFKGGMTEFYWFLAANLKYPKAMMRYNIQGKVIVSLTVEKDGSLSDIRSVQDIGYGSAEEAIRVLKKSPKWEPGFQNGQPVRVRYTLPITFALERSKDNDDTVSRVSFALQNDPPAQVADNKVANDTSRTFNMVMGNDFDFQANVLYVLDGKVVSGLNVISSDDIQSVKVIRHPNKENIYYILYGAKALNGVVVIESKKSAQKFALSR